MQTKNQKINRKELREIEIDQNIKGDKNNAQHIWVAHRK